MDVLCGFGRRGTSLANMATLLGLPGKLGFDGSQVWETYLAGDLARIRAYCETDVLNTWLIWLRFAQLRGELSPEAHAGGARAREGLPARGARAAPRRVPARLGVGRLSRPPAARARRRPRRPRTVDGLTHEGEGVVHGGKTAFVAGALPGEVVRFRAHRPSPPARRWRSCWRC